MIFWFNKKIIKIMIFNKYLKKIKIIIISKNILVKTIIKIK